MGRIRADLPWSHYLPNLYCTGCEATVTVTAGVCPANHRVNPNSTNSAPGRHRAAGRTPRLPRKFAVTTPRTALVGGALARPPSESGYVPAALSLPLVEMFGFDGADEVLGQDDYYEIQSYAPTRAVRTLEPVEPAKSARLGLFELLPRLNELGSVDASENTGTLVKRLWDATDGMDALEGSWQEMPTTHASRFGSSDRRWGLIATVIVTLILVLWAVIGLTPEPATSPDLSLAETALTDAQASVADLRTISGYIADPMTEGANLSQSAVILATIDRAARDLSTSASSFSGWDEYQAIARSLSAAADQGQMIEGRLGDGLTYRLVYDTMFALPPLPIEAAGTASATIGFDLAAMLSDTERSLDRLPRDPALTSHRFATAILHEDLLPLTDTYLEALRDGDITIAQVAANEITERIATNHDALATAFDQFAADIDELAAAYESDLTAARDSLNRTP